MVPLRRIRLIRSRHVLGATPTLAAMSLFGMVASTCINSSIAQSTGTVGNSYGNALAENVNGSYKNELIHNRTWDDVVDVEIATFEWVTWRNEARLHQGLDYRTPAEIESEFCKSKPGQEIIEIKANA